MLLGCVAVAPAFAGHVNVSVGIGLPVVGVGYYGGPAYYPAPAPVVYAPAPVYYAPAPVVYGPAVGVVVGPGGYYHGHGYYPRGGGYYHHGGYRVYGR
ncbi:hypothetical protein ISN76_06190 [Dyella halodurans]